MRNLATVHATLSVHSTWALAGELKKKVWIVIFVWTLFSFLVEDMLVPPPLPFVECDRIIWTGI
jgi:hypothetical protein